MRYFIGPMITAGFGVVCLVVFNVVGAEVLEDGTLSEPFFLIPLSMILLLVSFLWCIIALIYKTIKKKKHVGEAY